ncbi:MAG: lytic transglycosylase domain-containing protein [Desulfatiglandaceae bacterium]
MTGGWLTGNSRSDDGRNACGSRRNKAIEDTVNYQLAKHKRKIFGPRAWAVFIAAVVLTVSWGSASAISLKMKLEMLGYKANEIQAIISGKVSRGDVDRVFRRQMLGLPVTKSWSTPEQSSRKLAPAGAVTRGMENGKTTVKVMPEETTPGQKEGFRPTTRRLSPEKRSMSAPLQLDLAEKSAYPPQGAAQFLPIISNVAEKTALDRNLIMAVIKVESDFKPEAVSPKGAMGLMQLMPSTASSLGLANPFDPEENIYGGGRYLAQCINTFQNMKLALAAYNAGPHLVSRIKQIPPYPETQRFVKDVFYYKKLYDRLLLHPSQRKFSASGGG